MRTKYVLPAIVAAAALLLTGCVDNTTPSTDDVAPPSSATDCVEAPAGATAESLVPDDVKASGVLVVGVDPTYPPNESKDEAGNPVGWSMDLVDALAAELGLKVEYAVSSFDKIIPSITGGTYDIGFSSFTDNVEREKTVCFVNYFTAGVQWAQPIGANVDPANACGLTVSVQATTFEETDELPAKSKECTDAGNAEITILKFDTQDEASNAVALGRSDAMSADSPITQYAVSQLSDKIELAGPAFDDAPYGVAINKGSGLVAAVQAGLQAMMDDGTYAAILADWGVSDGAIAKATVNAAANG
ncbi:MAG: ABC transporter substrate-binding protein [Microbacteriaceae bacterium]|nr:ABC transporter substrate-binding protein [Microbacteriaceae bacterium]